MISFTLVLATGVKLIMIPFASASGPKPPAMLRAYYIRTSIQPHKGPFFPSNLVLLAFDKNMPFAYNTMQPCDTKSR